MNIYHARNAQLLSGSERVVLFQSSGRRVTLELTDDAVRDLAIFRLWGYSPTTVAIATRAIIDALGDIPDDRL